MPTTADLVTEDTTQEQGNVVGLVNGSAKTTTFLLRKELANGVTGELALDGDAEYLETEDNKAYFIYVNMVGRDGANTEAYFARRGALIKRGVGAASLTIEWSNAESWFDTLSALTTFVFTVNLTDGHIGVEVANTSGVSMDFVARAEVTEIGS